MKRPAILGIPSEQNTTYLQYYFSKKKSNTQSATQKPLCLKNSSPELARRRCPSACIYMYIYIYISADLSQSESVLAYIVIHQYLPILQNPISHYCNTLQSPILQIAIYLYCRVQLTDCSILKGVGLPGHSPPQPATGWPTFWPQIASNPPRNNAKQRKSMKTVSLDAPGPQWQ